MNEKITEIAKDAGVEIYQFDAGYGIVTRTALYDEDYRIEELRFFVPLLFMELLPGANFSITL